MTIIIDGKKIAAEIKEGLKKQAAELKSSGFPPKLHVILVGENPASKLYVGVKQRHCKEVGIDFELEELPVTIKEADLVKKIKALNADKKTSGIIVQLPLPNHINKGRVIEAIEPLKDVDALTPYNLGKLVLGDETLSAATSKGIVTLLEKSEVGLKGKSVVIINRSLNVGKPLIHLLLNRDATVTVCHSKTKNLEEFTKTADIIVCAVGKPGFLKKDMVKDGSIVIDVGLTYVDGKGIGDVDFDSVKEKASMITPVPGGVGPMTVAMVLENTVIAAKKQAGLII